MEKKFIKIASFAILILFALIACQKEDNNQDNQLSSKEVLKRFLELKSSMSGFQQQNNQKNLEALGASIFSGTNKSLKHLGDSTVTDTGYWQYWTCAEVSEFIDNDGNYVTVYDYGDQGCDEWGSLIKGKISYIWSQKDDEYYSKVIYENYSAYGMTMNGFSEYTYTFSNFYFEQDSNFIMNWSGSSSCIENIEMISSDGEKFLYTANYSSDWDENSYTVHEGEYSYKNVTTGYEYTYRINKDLFYNYACGWDIFVPVSGIEQIIYKDINISEEFVTDYGDGTCDNLAVITENGISYKVDFGEMWFTEPCEKEDCDSVVVHVDGSNGK